MKDWKERFNEKFVGIVQVPSNTTAISYKPSGIWKEDSCGGYETMTQPYQVIEFIEQELEAQRLAFIKMVENKMINKQVISLDEAGYNMALEDLLKEIKGEK